jgi:hypothetical protein
MNGNKVANEGGNTVPRAEGVISDGAENEITVKVVFRIKYNKALVRVLYLRDNKGFEYVLLQKNLHGGKWYDVFETDRDKITTDKDITIILKLLCDYTLDYMINDVMMRDEDTEITLNIEDYLSIYDSLQENRRLWDELKTKNLYRIWRGRDE